jgi:anaerobic magnesium-protoporphyrin IX monomethyl ester cyclase
VVGLCELILAEGLRIRWTCNSRVDAVDEELLRLMKRAGCWMMAWGIESGNEDILRHARKGINREKVARALQWSQAAGLTNFGYFIIGLPGETPATVRETISLSKSLPLDLALFHIAAPYPGTPFFREVQANGWFRPGVNWEEVDMEESTVLDYPEMKAEDLEYWQKRAFREWALRPGPALTYGKMLLDPANLRTTVDAGLKYLSWLVRR